jgi:hypothetical protein
VYHSVYLTATEYLKQEPLDFYFLDVATTDTAATGEVAVGGQPEMQRSLCHTFSM